MTDIIRPKPSSFEEYWLASKAWERKGLPLGTARALVNAGFFSVEDLHSAHDLELATIPRVGRKPRDSVWLDGSSDAWRTEEPDERQRAGTATAQASSTNVRQRARAASDRADNGVGHCGRTRGETTRLP
jgi:hypothetical protein